MRMGRERKIVLGSSLEWNLKIMLLVLCAFIIIYTVAYTGGKIQRLCLVSNKTLKKAKGFKLFCTCEGLDGHIMSSKVEYPSSGSQRSENHASVSRRASTAPLPVPEVNL